MTPEHEARARELFFAFDGSEFYMSRDGADVEFTALKVPKAKRREWMRELTAKYLARLDQPGNWKTLQVLSHHWDYAHVREALSAPPLGVWWQQVAFLEELLDYVGKARFRLRATQGDYAAAAATVLRYGQPLAAKVTDPDRRRRIAALIAKARQHTDDRAIAEGSSHDIGAR
jgi:hypothetical protein